MNNKPVVRGISVIGLLAPFAFSTPALAVDPPIAGPIPAITFYPENPAKTIVLEITAFDDGTFIHNNSVVSLKPASGYPASPADYGVQIIDVKNILVDEFTLPDPTTTRGYGPGGPHSKVTQPIADGIIKFGFESDASHVMVTNLHSNTPLATIDLKPHIYDFCLVNLADPDCYETDLAVQSSGVIDQLPLVLVGQSEPFLVRTSVVNNGPEAPAAGVDAQFDQQLSNIASGLSITPTGVTDQEAFGLLVGVPRVFEQTYQVTCNAPGLHQFTVTNSIRALSAAVIDLAPANDSGSVIVSVDCAVPVTLNIKPGSLPNPVNTKKSKKNGKVPAAVLTTAQGEYGNPLPFDATTILVASVHFGEPGLASTDQGAGEAHGKLHFEDSLELDETTSDGDLDAVMHFLINQTGLSLGDTQACIKGRFVDGADTFTFYGCDSVNVVH